MKKNKFEGKLSREIKEIIKKYEDIANEQHQCFTNFSSCYIFFFKRSYWSFIYFGNV
ncbi:hypothetical protein [Fusobacterium polymorphum]|jgi:hypothetical protein|uniref:hypothetical protein n=1 Tax=Fusobacterium nucleatum subsp. polymorphum TaxID=76857 RepID=UPI000AE987B0|nr:hypothetical protein [Fusobacterium polymorphum]